MLRENGRDLFRLAAVLCLVLTIYPIQKIKQNEPHTIEEGIGGGELVDEILFTEDGIFLSPVSLETTSIELMSLTKPHVLLNNSYIVQSGDNISTLAVSYGLYQDTIISYNKIANSRLLQIGRVLKIPNQDGILHTVRSGETLASIARSYDADIEVLQIVNELFSDFVAVGTDLFIPGARLDWGRLQEINGDLFIWPTVGTISSNYGYRRNPFNTAQYQFHNGVDIRGDIGTPVRAAMAGRVSAAGWDSILGNYIIITHHSGYRTLYAHLNVIRTRTGAYVAQGERIGDMGNTGQSTGPHLHFTVYKDGITVSPLSVMR